MNGTTSIFAQEMQNGTSLFSPTAPYVCPKCKGELNRAGGALRCDGCERTYPVRNDIPDFIGDELRDSPNWSLRHSTWFDWLAPIYETRLWYPVVMRLAGVKGIASLSELLTTIEQMTGTVSGSILDVACGPGTFGRRIAAHAQPVYGIDISPGMLVQGRAYAEREGVRDMHFARAQVESLPFASMTFAAAVCCGSLHLFENTSLALREVARTMKPDARLVGFTFTATDSRFSRFAGRHGARVFGKEELHDQLSDAGLKDQRLLTFGSALLFSGLRKGAAQ